MSKNRLSILRLSILGILALLIVGAQLGLTGFATGTKSPTQAAQVAYPTPEPPGKPAPGTENAIADGPAPRVAGAPAVRPSIPNAGPGQAAFTTDDVKRYFDEGQARRNGVNGIADYASDAPVSIAKIEFLTLRELQAKHPYIEPNLPGDTLLCYVQYKGEFQMLDVSQGGKVSKTTVLPYAFEVLDAQTGNQYMYGVDVKLR